MKTLQPFFAIGYLVLSITQFFAIWDYIGEGFFAFIGAIILASIPLIGSVAGVMGAYEAWGWDLVPAIALFFWWVPIIGIALLSDLLKSD